MAKVRMIFGSKYVIAGRQLVRGRVYSVTDEQAAYLCSRTTLDKRKIERPYFERCDDAPEATVPAFTREPEPEDPPPPPTKPAPVFTQDPAASAPAPAPVFTPATAAPAASAPAPVATPVPKSDELPDE